MSAKHTPGLLLGDPLHILPGQVGDHWQVYIHAEGGNKTVALAYGDSREEAIANARLIAAAPELLSALVELVDWSDRNGCSDAFLADARAAIAKAEGAK